MPVSNKPMFSRPVLALVMVLCTLAIWLLNLTAPSNNLPEPNIDTWHTSSNIPVTWVHHANWEQGDKLEIRFVFHSDEANLSLVQTTLAMLMSNSLPISTASINQRLAPLAAQVSSYYDHESQIIGLTLSNQSQYLNPTLALVTNWLKQPDFKSRTFEQWQRQQKNTQSSKHTFSKSLFNEEETRLQDVSLEEVRNFYRTLQSSAFQIYVVGNIPEQVKSTIENTLNQISMDYQKADISSPHTNSFSNQITELNKQDNTALWQSRSAIAVTPISSVKEWISLQIWGADMVSTMNRQTNIDFIQLGLTLSPQRPWAGWSVQYAADLIADAEQIKTVAPRKDMSAGHLIIRDNLPSVKDSEVFTNLFNQFTEQLEKQTQSATWWSYMATQVMHDDGKLSLQDFIASYKEAINTFTRDDYKSAINTLLQTDSYQEIQTYQ
ncbi:insulinase family protein [Marinomonas sp.]|nr:insulinase family protein [Marinomonas sp.]MDB4837137.1 insulinase family protein [Marinomonas sp.]